MDSVPMLTKLTQTSLISGSSKLCNFGSLGSLELPEDLDDFPLGAFFFGSGAPRLNSAGRIESKREARASNNSSEI